MQVTEYIFVLFIFWGHTEQGSVGPYEMLEIELGSAKCKQMPYLLWCHSSLSD